MNKPFISFIFFLILATQPSLAATASPLLVATGVDSATEYPLLTASNDNGKTWATTLPVAYKAKFEPVACTGSSTNTLCLAAGYVPKGDFEKEPPALLYFSKDRGMSWTHIDIPYMTTHALFNTASCTGNDDAVCFAAGYSAAYLSPMLVVTTDGGKSWSAKSVPDLTEKAVFLGGSCTGRGSTAVCVVVGQSYGTGPVIAVSKDGGNIWSLKNISGISNLGRMIDVSCTGHSANAMCVAIGSSYQKATQQDLIAVSTDGGDTWNLQSIAGDAKKDLSLQTVSCTGEAPNSVCAIAGTTSAYVPFVATSNDNGNNWTRKTISGSPATGNFASVTCTGNGNSAVCAAAGGSTTNYALAVSSDGAATWSAKKLPAGLDNAILSRIHCATSGAAVTCMAVGNLLGAKGFIVGSLDKGSSWQLPAGNPNGTLFGAQVLTAE